MFAEDWLGPHSLLLHQPPLREVQMGQVAIMAALYQAWFLSLSFFFSSKPSFWRRGFWEKGFLWRDKGKGDLSLGGLTGALFLKLFIA